MSRNGRRSRWIQPGKLIYDLTNEVRLAFDEFEPVSEEDADMFKSERRRELVNQLVGDENGWFSKLELSPTILNEAATEIAALENDKPVDEVSSKEKRRTYVTIYQHHVPELEEQGWISYDEDTMEVQPDPILHEKIPQLRQVERFLNHEQDAYSNGYRPEDNEDFSSNGNLEDPHLEIGMFYDMLSNSRRRKVIEYLKSDEDDVLDISRVLRASELDQDVSEVGSLERKNVYVPLHQEHLPKLDSCGIVEYDDRGKNVGRGRNFPLVSVYVDEELPIETDEELDEPEYSLSGVMNGLL